MKKRIEDILKSDIVIPDIVQNQVNQAFSEIREGKQKMSTGADCTERKINKVKRGRSLLKAAAVIVVMTGALLYYTPTIAAKFPYIGRIFEQIEEHLTFSGDYTKNNIELTEEDMAEAVRAEKYTAEDQGIVITASETVSDGYSLYLTASIISYDDQFNEILPIYVRESEENTAAQIYIKGSWILNGTEYDIESEMEGKIVDDSIFVGMLKFDFPGKVENKNEVKIVITSIEYDNIEVEGVEHSSSSHLINGQWELEVPFITEEKENKRIAINETHDHIQIDELVITPYQVIVYGNNDSLEERVTEEIREEMLQINPNMMDGEMFDILGWNNVSYYITLFDQNGEKLNFVNESSGEIRFATNGKEIDKLHILVFNSFEAWLQVEKEGEDSAVSQTAVIDKWVMVE